MTTCLDIVTRALRTQGVIASGQGASGNDAADGLQHLQDVINDLPLFRDGNWTDVLLTDDSAYTASDGERINTQGHAPAITLPTTYTDDCGQTQAMRDLSRIQIIGGDQAGLYLYAASLGAWNRADDLALTDDLPFGAEDESGLAALTAVAMVDEYGSEVSQAVIGRATAAITSFRARFYREVVVGVDHAFLRTSDLGDWSFRWGTV